jgi:hypothetical protein
MSIDMFNRLQSAFDEQMPPDAPRYREPTEAEIVARTADVLKRWEEDDSKLMEAIADAICCAPLKTTESLAALWHQGDDCAFAKDLRALVEPRWNAEARQQAIDDLEGLV